MLRGEISEIRLPAGQGTFPAAAASACTPTTSAKHAVEAVIFPTTPLTARPMRRHRLTVVELNGESVPTFAIYIRNTDPGSNANIPGLSIPLTVSEREAAGGRRDRRARGQRPAPARHRRRHRASSATKQCSGRSQTKPINKGIIVISSGFAGLSRRTAVATAGTKGAAASAVGLAIAGSARRARPGPGTRGGRRHGGKTRGEPAGGAERDHGAQRDDDRTGRHP